MNMTRAEIDEHYEGSDMMLLGHEFDDALLGVCQQFGRTVTAAYDFDKIIGALTQQGLTPEEALEHYEYNILGAYVGDGTPVFIKLMNQGGLILP